MDFRTRAEWGATYDVTTRPLMTGLPVAVVFIHHTVTTPTADPDADMRAVEAVDIAKFGVPSYSYVVHPSGVVLEGMGLHRGAHTIDNNGGPLRYGFNDIAFGISFIGNYELDDPTQRSIDACRELIDNLRVARYLRDGYTIRGHRDVYATACPGRNLYPRLTELYPIPTPPPASEAPDMQGPATITDSLGRRWVFFRGLDGALWARCAPDPSFTLGGKVTDAITASPGPDGQIDVYAYSPPPPDGDGRVWSRHNDGKQFGDWYPL